MLHLTSSKHMADFRSTDKKIRASRLILTKQNRGLESLNLSKIQCRRDVYQSMAQTSQIDDTLVGYISNIILSTYSPYNYASPLPIDNIFPLPASFRDRDKSAYTPRSISIGLIHQKTVNATRGMNHNKLRFTSSLLKRPHPDSKETVRMCTITMERTTANDFYPEEFRLECKETEKIMLVDGCFILELLFLWHSGGISKEYTRSELNDIIHDLLLVENQMPFSTLRNLFKHTIKRIPAEGNPGLSLEQLVVNFFCSESNSHFKTRTTPVMTEDTGIEHILSLVHRCYLPPAPESAHGNFLIRRHSATEIFSSGINMKPNGNESTYLDVSFKRPCLFSWIPNITTIFMFPWWVAIFIYNTIFSSSTPTASTQLPLSMPTNKGRTVRVSCCWLSSICQLFRRASLGIPQLEITESTESFLRNLIAYELFAEGEPRHIMSYAFLMDTIINTKEHIEMLETSGVLKNYLVSSEDAAELFNSICNNVALGDEFYFSEQWKHVDAYCNLKWPSLLGSLRVTYFGNPWTGVSVFAALLLFAFTGLQTVGTVVQTWY